MGLDIGSSYVKAVVLRSENPPAIEAKYLEKTGYDLSAAVESVLSHVPTPFVLGVTGYGRSRWKGMVRKTEISALARAVQALGVTDGTVVDIGGQDCKVLKIRNGALIDHALNRRCAAGTGSYLEFIAHRLNIAPDALNDRAAQASGMHRLNSFCTVFASTEILDCMNRDIPLPHLIRGLYASIAERVSEIASLDSPVYLSGGVIGHHPVLVDGFKMVLDKDIDINVLPDPQYLAALGMAVYVQEIIEKGDTPHERTVSKFADTPG